MFKNLNVSMVKPFFSIVIPTFNRASFITKTIKSILNQTYINFEIIVIDDGSSDNTEEVVKDIYDDRLSYYYIENAERGAARNFGAKLAKGDYINFFDSDDLAYDLHLESANKIILENNSPEVFHLNFDIKNSEDEIIRTPSKIRNINKQLIYGNILSCNGVFIRKDIALANPFNENRILSGSEDYLLWLILGSKYKILNNNTKTTAIIEHENRSVLGSDKDKLIKRKELFINLIFSDSSLWIFYRKYRKIILSQVYSYIALHVAMIKKNRLLSLKYLIKSIYSYPLSIFSKRFLATLKHNI